MVRDDTMVYLGIYINVRLQALHPYICNNAVLPHIFSSFHYRNRNFRELHYSKHYL